LDFWYVVANGSLEIRVWLQRKYLGVGIVSFIAVWMNKRQAIIGGSIRSNPDSFEQKPDARLKLRRGLELALP
jgi:hypothetical protein